MSLAEPSINDLSPVVPTGVEKEPVILIDTSGSMSWPVSDTPGAPRRMDVLGEAIGTLVTALGAEDSQAEAEAAAGETDKGGLMTVTFNTEATEVGDLNEGNWKRLWDGIQWGGGTSIMPAWELAVDDYMEEFGEQPKQDRPALLVLVVTDGEASDMADFEAECAKAQGNTYISVSILGYGPDHDNTLAAYQKIAASNPHVRVTSFGSETDPNTIAQGLISLAG